jgi:hypothetical protein
MKVSPAIMCGLSAFVIATVGAPRDASAIVRPMATGAKLHGFVYVTSRGAVNVYDQAGQKQKPIATLTSGIDNPRGLFVARNGDLLVANAGNGTVSIFHRGTTTPYRTLTNVGTGAQDVTEDAGGYIYATETKGNDIAVFAPGSTTPTAMLKDPNGPQSLVTDSKGDLFVQTRGRKPPKYVSYVDEFVAGSPNPETLPHSSKESPGGIAIDANDNLLVCEAGGQDGYGGNGELYAPPYTGKPTFVFYIFDGITQCALDSADLVWVSANGNSAAAILVNHANKIRDVIPLGFQELSGIAVDAF